MSWQSNPCMAAVHSLIPVPVPLFHVQMAEELCALNVPHTYIAAILLELLLGSESADVSRPQDNKRKAALAKALLDAQRSPLILQQLAEDAWQGFNWALWLEVVAWIWRKQPDAPRHLIQTILMDVISGRITTTKSLPTFFPTGDEVAPRGNGPVVQK